MICDGSPDVDSDSYVLFFYHMRNNNVMTKSSSENGFIGKAQMHEITTQKTNSAALAILYW